MKQNKKEFGGAGEELAGRYLEEHGFRIIEKNYRYGKGEIDIVAREDDYLVFVEVKTRHSLNFGEPEYAISRGKLNQIKKIASAYLWEKEIEDQDCRIDVVTILFQGKESPQINHIRNAFMI
jgi:putative endonuclease